MFGFGKKKKDDIQEVKDIVEPARPIMPRQTEIAINRIDIPSSSEPKSFAPLFIKIDKYKEVLQKVQKMKSIVNNLNRLIVLQDSIEKARADSLDAMKKNIQDFQSTIQTLDQELVRPQQMEPFIRDTQTQKIDTYTNQLEDEIGKLKEQLNKF
ncbi:MAG: hypothetical protein KJ906_01575 [Nanoarchaeota archaeon]|nr:hypothetical protein [Nanoarchaeota archaeon]